MTQFGGQAIVGEYPLPARIKFIIPISKAQIIINCLKRLIEEKKTTFNQRNINKA